MKDMLMKYRKSDIWWVNVRDINNGKYGWYLKNIRLQEKIKQMDVAEFIGITSSNLSNHESDHRKWSLDLAKSYVFALETLDHSE